MSLLQNNPLIFTTRLVIGTLFVISGVVKAADPLAFSSLIGNYQLLSPTFNLVIASFLPWVELVCGFAVLFGVSFRGGSLVLGSMTILFTLAVISGLARDLDISCGCFTLDPEASRIGWQKVAENIGIIVLCAVLVYARTDGGRLLPLPKADPTAE